MAILKRGCIKISGSCSVSAGNLRRVHTGYSNFFHMMTNNSFLAYTVEYYNMVMLLFVQHFILYYTTPCCAFSFWIISRGLLPSTAQYRHKAFCGRISSQAVYCHLKSDFIVHGNQAIYLPRRYILLVGITILLQHSHSTADTPIYIIITHILTTVNNPRF